MTNGVIRSLSGTLRYTSDQEHRKGAERGREFFRIDIRPDGSRSISAHGQIDDDPSVVRDVNLLVGPRREPLECFVRIAVGGVHRGSAFFRFSEGLAQCEATTSAEGQFSQQMRFDNPVPAFGNHAMINDGFLVSLYDLSKGPGIQVINQLLLSSPDHRGATGPMLFPVDLALEFVGKEDVTVTAGAFESLHFRMVDVPGLPLEHPAYDLWVTADDDYVLLKAQVGGYMQTAYELTEYHVLDY